LKDWRLRNEPGKPQLIIIDVSGDRQVSFHRIFLRTGSAAAFLTHAKQICAIPAAASRQVVADGRADNSSVFKNAF